MKSKRKFTPEFKSKVALEALKERESVTELAKKYERSIKNTPNLLLWGYQPCSSGL
jgi:transposase-like protein